MSSRDATRRRIVRAGRQAFGEVGFYDTGVDDIVRAAEIGRATFYLHFANKDAVFAAIVDEIAADLRSVASHLAPITPDEPGRHALAEWIGELHDLVAESAPFIAAWMEAGRALDEYGPQGESAFVDFSAQVGAQIRAGGAPGVKPRVAAMAILAMVDRFVVQVQLGDLTIDRAERVQLLADLVIEMLHPSSTFDGVSR